MSLAQLRAIVKEVAPTLQHADLADVVSAAMVKAQTCGPQKAVRYALADWLRDQVEVPQPTEDTELRKELQKAKRSVRAASPDELAKWDKLLSRLPERERQVAERLAAGYSHRDIGAELRINAGTVTRVVAKIRARFIDPQLWHPILDALYGLPDSRIGRAGWVTDLSEYRRPRTAQRRSVFACKGEVFAPRFATWFVPCHEKRTTIHWTINCETPKPRPTKGAYAVVLLPDEPRKESTVELTARELAGMERGERFLFEYRRPPIVTRRVDRELIRETKTHFVYAERRVKVTTTESGWMVSSPVIRRDTRNYANPDGFYDCELIG